MTNPNAVSAVKLGPGILGREGFLTAQDNAAHQAGHIGLGPRLRQKRVDAPEAVAASVAVSPEQAIHARLAAEPSAWRTVLMQEAERAGGPRPAVLRSLAQMGPRSVDDPMPEDVRDDLLAMVNGTATVG